MAELSKKVLAQLAALVPDDGGEDGDGEDTDVLDALSPQLRKPSDIFIMQDPLRPTSMDEIIGQDHVKRSLNIAIDSAVRRERVLDHVLFTGGPGLGKTTFASVIASRQKSNLILDTGPALTQKKLLEHMAKIITAKKTAEANPNEVGKTTLFIDEFHGLPKEAATLLLPIMEDFNFMGMHVPEFTLIAATTDEAKIPHALRERFTRDYNLYYYSTSEIMQIVTRSFSLIWGLTEKERDKRLADVPGENLFGFPVHSEERKALEMIASRSTGVPRVANRLLKQVFDLAIDYLPHDRDHKEAQLTPDIVEEAMSMAGIDKYGLGRAERRIIQTMFEKHGTTPRSTSAIAAAAGMKEANVAEVYEPLLLRLGYMQRESRGRVLTDKGVFIAGLIQSGNVPFGD